MMRRIGLLTLLMLALAPSVFAQSPSLRTATADLYGAVGSQPPAEVGAHGTLSQIPATSQPDQLPISEVYRQSELPPPPNPSLPPQAELDRIFGLSRGAPPLTSGPLSELADEFPTFAEIYLGGVAFIGGVIFMTTLTPVWSWFARRYGNSWGMIWGLVPALIAAAFFGVVTGAVWPISAMMLVLSLLSRWPRPYSGPVFA